MSPNERTLNSTLMATSLNCSAEFSANGSRNMDYTVDRIMARSTSSRSTSSRSMQPNWFAPVTNSSPQKGSLTANNVVHMHHSRAALPLSPPLSPYGSNPSSSRSVEDDLTAEFEQISSGLAGLSRQAAVAWKYASLECHDRDLVHECNRLVGILPKEKKKRPPPIFHAEDSNFHIHSSSSDSSSERLHAGGSGIENPRNVLSRGIASDGFFSPTYDSPQRLIHEEKKREIEGNGRRTEGTQTENERRRNNMMSRGTGMEEEEEEDRRTRRTRKKERVRIVDDRSSHSPPELERLPPRRERSTTVREPQRREVQQREMAHSVDGVRMAGMLDLSLPSVFSLPSRIRYEPLQLPTTYIPRLEQMEMGERRRSPRREKEVNGRGVRVDKSRMEVMKEEKEKRAIDCFPPVVDIDQLRGRRKCALATKATLGGEAVRKTIGVEKKAVRRGVSVGVRTEKRREGPVVTTMKKAAFVASSQVDGVSHSLGANRQQLLNLIKCHLPQIHMRVKEYLEGRSSKEHDVISGLRKFLMDELSKVENEQEAKFSAYDEMKDGEKKEELGKDISRSDIFLTEGGYLVGQLEYLGSSSTSSSVVNQLRSIYSHLLKCAPLRSEE